MSSKPIDWSNEKQVRAAVKRFPEIFEVEIRRGLVGMSDLLVGTIVELTPSGVGDGAWGHLSNSIQGGEPVRTQQGWKVEIGSPAEYVDVIEHGRTPGATPPPVDPIAKWVWGRRYLFPEVKTEEDALKIAYPIAKAIGKRGFASAAQGQGKGWGMFAEAVKKDMTQINQLAAAIRERIAMLCTKAANGQ
jgi:hypothetical protein